MSILDHKVVQPGNESLSEKYRYEPTLRELVRKYYDNETIPKELRKRLTLHYIRQINNEINRQWDER